MNRNFISVFIRAINNKLFSLKGRANRKEYVIFYVFECVVFTPFLILEKNNGMTPLLIIILGICVLVHVFAHTSLLVRRLHDLNFSGWWFFLSLIFSPVVFLILCFIKGNKDNNKYGEPPKG